MRKYFYTFTTILLLIFTSSCTKNDNSTIILIGEESNVVDFNTFCNKTLQNAMLHYGYEADTLSSSFHLMTPPNVEGRFYDSVAFYIAMEEILNYGSDDPTYMSEWKDYINDAQLEKLVIEFKKQHNSSLCVEYQWISGIDTTYDIRTENAYVVGATIDGVQDTIFIVYFDCLKGYPDPSAGWDCNSRRCEMITGTMKKNGIKKLRFASILTEKWGADAVKLPRVGDFRVAQDRGDRIGRDYVTPRINN